MFEHGDVKLNEAAAICSYLDSAFEGPPLHPSDPIELARMYEVVSITSSYLYPPAILQYALQYASPSGPDGDLDRGVVDRAIPDIRMALETLDTSFGGSRWFCTDNSPTIADLNVGPLLFTLSILPEGAELLEGLDHLARLRSQLLEVPSFISVGPRFVRRGEVETTVSGEGEGPYRFTAWWHTTNDAEWRRALAPYVGRPGLSYLEVGVFEGRSLIWMLENVLTHPTSEAIAVDPFRNGKEAAYDANIAASGASGLVTTLKEPSQTALRRLPPDSFDVIYLDGSHTAADVLADAVLSWDLLHVDGLIIFDDYSWRGRLFGPPLPPELLPRFAIDTFVAAHRHELESELTSGGAQMIIRKLDNPCDLKDYSSAVGQYLYFWRQRELRDADGKVLPLSHEEVALVETIVKARPANEVERPFGETRLFKQLVARLDLSL